MRIYFQRNLVTGLLTVIPIVVTIWVIGMLFNLFASYGRPLVGLMVAWLRPVSPALLRGLAVPWLESTLAALVVVAALYVLGMMATAVVGRKILTIIDGLIARVPLVETIYTSAKKVIDSMQQKTESAQRVVLIDFPSPEMKAVGLLTKSFLDVSSGRELAAVYVPTTPNPTSGYVEIVPVDRLVFLDWSLNQAMTFIMSGGAVAPEQINYSRAGSDAITSQAGPA